MTRSEDDFSILFGVFETVTKGGDGPYMVVFNESSSDVTTFKLFDLQKKAIKNLARTDSKEWMDKYNAAPDMIIVFDSDGKEIKRFESDTTREVVDVWIAEYNKPKFEFKLFKIEIPGTYIVKKDIAK